MYATAGRGRQGGVTAAGPEVLVGRQGELELLTSTFDEVRSARPKTLLISGPAGIGKSALLRRFLEPFRGEGRLLYADGDEDERRIPFGVLHQLLLGLDRPLGERIADVVAGSSPAPDPLAMGVALLAAIGELQEDGPIVIAVDDAPWADRPSLEAITFALRRLRADQVLALVALRSGEEAALPTGLLRLAAEPTGRTLRLDGLSSTDLRDLSLASGLGELSPRASRRLHEYTEGNPLYALTLLRELGPAALRGEDPVPAPPSLSVLLLSRLAGCSEAAVRFVQAASVLGRRSELEVAARMAGLDDPMLALGEAMDAGLLTADADGPHRVTFTHPLAHAAVYGDLGPARRAALHRRAAELLNGEDALDHRIRAADPADETLADELRDRAADESARGMLPTAARHLVAAARLHPGADVRADAVMRAAALMLASNDYAGAAALEGQLRALEPGPWRDYVLGHLTIGLGKLAAAMALCEPPIPSVSPSWWA